MDGAEKLAVALVAGALGSVTTGWVQAVTLGHRITRLETLVKIIASKMGVDA